MARIDVNRTSNWRQRAKRYARLDLPNQGADFGPLFRCRPHTQATKSAREELVQTAAFQNLGRAGQRSTVEDPTALTGLDPGMVIGYVDTMRQVGRTAQVLMISSRELLHLSLSPTQHETSVNWRRFWTCCALDVPAMFGALSASGFAKSGDHYSHESIVPQSIVRVPQENELHRFNLAFF